MHLDLLTKGVLKTKTPKIPMTLRLENGNFSYPRPSIWLTLGLKANFRPS